MSPVHNITKVLQDEEEDAYNFENAIPLAQLSVTEASAHEDSFRAWNGKQRVH